MKILFTIALKILLISVLEQGSCPGYIFIIELAGYKFGHIPKIHLTTLKNYVQFLTEGITIKVKEVHIIQANKITNFLMEMAKPFLTKEIKEMIHCYTDMDKFYEVVPKEYITKDLGGSLPLTRDEYDEIQREKMTALSKDADIELHKRSISHD